MLICDPIGSFWDSCARDCRLTEGACCCHVLGVMSVTLELELPDSVAAQAKAKGLLDPKRLATLIARELAAETGSRNFFEIVRQIRAQPGVPMTAEEIEAEVKTVRAEKRAREAGR